MKTIPKRTDLYSNPTNRDQNIEKQMSQLLEIKNLLNSKLNILTKTIGEDIFKFTTKNYPHERKDINLINMQNNLFGTDRTFGQFSIDFKELMLKLQSQVRGVIEIMQKFSFTKNISAFINNGIMDGFLKINDLMLRRQDFCNKLLQKIQQNVMNGTTIFSKHFGSNSLCMKCGSNLQKEKVISTKQSILLGGPKISNLYHKQLLFTNQQDDESNTEINVYDKITKARSNLKAISGTDPHEIISEEDIRYNLERLQNNIEQRKYDILACLMEMGQFGSTLIKSSEILEQAMKQNSSTKQISKFSSLLPAIHKLPPKFNFKQFTFDVSKYFYKEIKDIETQLLGIKTKYSALLSAQYQHSLSKQVQCDISKDQYEKQMDKYKKKTQRQISGLNERITQIQQLNKGYKSKINEYENALKSQIFSKIDSDDQKVENITIQKRISKLVDQYEKRIKVQQQELKSFRQSELNSQSLIKMQKIISDFQTSCTDILNEGQKLKQASNLNNEKENLTKDLVKNEDIEVRKKISLFLQPILKRLSIGGQNKGSSNQIISIENQVQKMLPFEQISKFVSDKNLSRDNLPRNRRQSILMLQNSQKGLKICSNIMEIHVISSKFSSIQHNLRRTNTKPIQRRRSQVLHPRQIQILSDKESNKILLHFNQRQMVPKVKQLKSPKLTKVKSQENAKTDKIDRSYEEKEIFKQGKKIQINNTEALKRYTSEHNGIIIDKKLAISTGKNSKEKAIKKSLKALSLTILKKGEQDQPKSSIKLPSISQYQKSIKKLDKIKQIQKIPQMNIKSNLLMKKKRKKRNFSQQTVTMQTLFNNHEMTMSLGSNLQKQVKNKNKKQYIIDFIPKIQQSNVSKCKQDQKVVIQGQISRLFDIKQIKKNQIELKKIKKGKYFTKTMHSKDNDDYVAQKLKKQEIQLSTKLYSLMATLKSTDYAIYKSIREKLRQQYEKKLRIKTNCDHISMTMDVGENSVSHLPLSLSLNHVEMQGCESSFQLKKQIYQSMSTNSNEIEGDLINKKDPDKIKQQHEIKPDNAELNKIINYLIVKHRNSCLDTQNKQDINKKGNLKICDHLLNFYQSLVMFAQKSPSQPSTIQRK